MVDHALFAHLHRSYQLRIEVSQMDAMLGAGLGVDWFPVRHTSAGFATDRPHGSVALNVFLRVLGVPLNLDCSEFEVDPRATDAPTQRTVARRG